MSFISKFLNWSKRFHRRTYAGWKVLRSVKSGHTCPVCKKALSRIAYSRTVDPRYHCNSCGYEGLIKL